MEHRDLTSRSDRCDGDSVGGGGRRRRPVGRYALCRCNDLLDDLDERGVPPGRPHLIERLIWGMCELEFGEAAGLVIGSTYRDCHQDDDFAICAREQRW